MKRLRKVLKSIAIVFFCLLFVLIIFPLKNGRSLKKASADSLDAYPSVCLGGWQNPGNAAGTPDVPPGGDSFTGDNSAVLSQAQAQIFCGSFEGADESQPPSSVTLYFSWNVIFSDEASQATSTDSDDASWSSVLDTTSTASSTSSSTVSTTTPATTTPTTSPTPTTTPATVAPTSTPPSSPTTTIIALPATTTTTLPTTSSSSPAPITTPATVASTSTSSSASSTSFLQNVMNDSLGFLIEKTFADSSGTIASDTVTATATSTTTATTTVIDEAPGAFVDVSYSLDGTTWQDLGQVTESNWQGFSVTIPVNSWSEINQLQIQLNPLITTDPPTIYLDGMWLQVDYGQTALGLLENGADDALNAVSDLSDTVDNALTDATDAITNLLPTDNTNPQPQNTPETNAAPNTAPPPPPPAPPQNPYTMNMSSTFTVNTKNLAWVPRGPSTTAMTPPQSQIGVMPTVVLTSSSTIQISGPCFGSYYTILIFRNPGDYSTDPAGALFNEASPCVNSAFNQTIADTDLPPSLASGTYYIMVANQGKHGPWQPDPTVYPIVLGDANASSSQ